MISNYDWYFPWNTNNETKKKNCAKWVQRSEIYTYNSNESPFVAKFNYAHFKIAYIWTNKQMRTNFSGVTKICLSNRIMRYFHMCELCFKKFVSTRRNFIVFHTGSGLVLRLSNALIRKNFCGFELLMSLITTMGSYPDQIYLRTRTKTIFKATYFRIIQIFCLGYLTQYIVPSNDI